SGGARRRPAARQRARDPVGRDPARGADAFVRARERPRRPEREQGGVEGGAPLQRPRIAVAPTGAPGAGTGTSRVAAHDRRRADPDEQRPSRAGPEPGGRARTLPDRPRERAPGPAPASADAAVGGRERAPPRREAPARGAQARTARARGLTLRDALVRPRRARPAYGRSPEN